jgi:hypothetical protein
LLLAAIVAKSWVVLNVCRKSAHEFSNSLGTGTVGPMRAIILSVTISALTLLAFTPSNAEDEVRDGGREHEPQAFLTPTVTYQTIARRAGIGSPGYPPKR